MKAKTIIFTSVALISFALFTNFLAAAQSNDDAVYDELQKKIREYEKKIANLQGKEQTLQREIDYADSQITLTELRIQNSIADITKKTKQITDLAQDIEGLKVRIDRLTQSVKFQEKVLFERLRARYKAFGVSPLIVLFGSSTLDTIVQKTEYLKIMQLQDKKLLDQMVETKDAYGKQKDLFEDKKKKVEVLKAQVEAEKANLETYKTNLASQRKAKEELLEETENDEQKFQALLAQVRSELAALELANNLPAGEGEEVKAGDTIGYMGNTGCSSGPHVHFGYIKNGKAKDPLPKLESGYLKWPVKNYVITQYFGENYDFYMRNFGISGHDALDMAVAGCPGCAGAPIKAARDGMLYYAKDSRVYCSWLNNSIGNGAIIDHGDGEKTIYWHLK